MPIDYSKYPPDWQETVARILARAKNRCEFCGAANKRMLKSIRLPLKVNGKASWRRIWLSSGRDVRRLELLGLDLQEKLVKVVLTVAHLDHDEENHAVTDDRLKAACQWCHLNYDAQEKAARRANNKIPVLFYYCDDKRHLVCKPYSVENLHTMAAELGIKRCWFHKDHYDIPKRRIAEITAKCILVEPREILKIIRG